MTSERGMMNIRSSFDPRSARQRRAAIALLLGLAVVAIVLGVERIDAPAARVAGSAAAGRTSPPAPADATEVGALRGELHALGLRAIEVCDRACASGPAQADAEAMAERGAPALIVDADAPQAATLVRALRARHDHALVVLTTAVDVSVFLAALAPQPPDWVAVSLRDSAVSTGAQPEFRLVMLASDGSLFDRSGVVHRAPLVSPGSVLPGTRDPQPAARP